MESPHPNFRNVDWPAFREVLEKKLAEVHPAQKITNQRQLDQCCADLTQVIQSTIHEQVLVTKITLKSKRWWTKELMQLRRQAEKLGRQSYKCRSQPLHRIHSEHKEAAKRYDRGRSLNSYHHHV